MEGSRRGMVCELKEVVVGPPMPKAKGEKAALADIAENKIENKNRPTMATERRGEWTERGPMGAD